MPSGFKTFGEEEFDRVFMKETEIIDNFVGTRLWTTGPGGDGILGTNNTTQRSSPGTTAGGGTNWKQAVSEGTSNMAAIKTDGTLWTWGLNNSGHLGDNTTTNRSSPGTTVGGGTTWKQVTSGTRCMAAVKTDGTLWTWGDNYRGGLGTGASGNRSSPGTTAGGGSNWKQVAMNNSGVTRNHTAAIKTDGTLWTWGHNLGGGLGDNSTADRNSPGTTVGGGTNWKQVSCGSYGTAAVKTDGTLWTWGNNGSGQLGINNTTNRSSPGTTAGGGTNWKQVSCSYSHMAAVKTDGTLWTWGDNFRGKLGEGTTTARSSPGTTVGGGTNWKFINAGGEQTCGIKTDGTIWGWGRDQYGALGTNDLNSGRASPISIFYGIATSWKQVSTGGTSVAIGD
jgi:alpha-tubulin suppressor-like RCC1 family protein